MVIFLDGYTFNPPPVSNDPNNANNLSYHVQEASALFNNWAQGTPTGGYVKYRDQDSYTHRDPLSILPRHGRLVDADAAKKQLIHDECEGCWHYCGEDCENLDCQNCFVNKLIQFLDELETVIPATEDLKDV